ncbi:MAG: hypothetical protein Q9194_005449 [Teloschistes cf. exilis]
MSGYFRGLVAKRLSLLVSSPQPSHPLATFPTTSNDDPSRASFLPVFNPKVSSAEILTYGISGQATRPEVITIPSSAPANDMSTSKRGSSENGTVGSATEESQSMPSSADTLLDLSSQSDGQANKPYSDAITQTAPSTPETETSNLDDSRIDQDQGKSLDLIDQRLASGDHLHSESEPAPKDDAEKPNIMHGSGEVFTANLHGRSCLAMLVTRDLIQWVNAMSAARSELERLELKLQEANRKVSLGTHTIEYTEKLIQTIESQEVIDKLRGTIGQHRSAIEKGKPQQDALQPEGASIDEKADQVGDDITISDSGSEASMEELYRRRIYAEAEQSHEELLEAQRQFDARDDDDAKHRARFQELLEKGTAPISPTEFDYCAIDATR